ncbi:hypothetical protein SAMN06265795_12830 [Noviherbaspirillum humi]|uniref:Uncharacterized protein n=1 Tax=Noviherbaspirillum humi TaxID=1688639 RepID=A0A239M0M7_9BURK|nr:hypothetical protein [Noviherbaspirillum humi]SNT35623.1 hypothetical protein SAMN06265795_12830 [Noviherbaspirillum humi]
MMIRLAVLMASIVFSGTAPAQGLGSGKNAKHPTHIDSKTTGPQDSIGTAGESPTKEVIQNRKKGGGKSSGAASSASGPSSGASTAAGSPGGTQTGQGDNRRGQ